MAKSFGSGMFSFIVVVVVVVSLPLSFSSPCALRTPDELSRCDDATQTRTSSDVARAGRGDVVREEAKRQTRQK